MTALRLEGLTRRYGSFVAVDGVGLEIDSGEMVALLGPSGAGKTTTLELIAGLQRPSAGDIKLDGQSVIEEAPERRRIVLMLQNPSLFPYMSIGRNTAFGLKMRHTPRAEADRAASQMLERVGLAGFEARRPAELSGGEQQRVALARALLAKPRVLLLDEPLAHLDPEMRRDLRGLIRQIQQETRLTTLLVTHDQQEAVEMGGRIAVMFEGQIEQVGRPVDLYDRPATARVARFFGSPNLIAGRPDGEAFATRIGRFRCDAPLHEKTRLITIRPEAVLLGEGGPDNTIEARIMESHYRGTHVTIHLTVGDTTLEASVQPERARDFSVGDIVKVTLPPTKLWPVTARD
ncbi:MAG: ABC transporter ATP-binding protein [Acidimicrobiia bacterium]